MKITVFGASGKVGRLVVAELLIKGHKVIAFTHSSKMLSVDPSMTFVQGDIYDKKSVEKAIKGSDLVISTLGSWGTPKKDVLSCAMINIIPAMKKHGVKRIISLTGSDARANGDTLGFIHQLSHFMISLLQKKVLADGEEHIRLLENSNLEWTVIRSSIMNTQGNPSRYNLSFVRPKPWNTINRISVANAIIEQIEYKDYIQKAPYVNRG